MVKLHKCVVYAKQMHTMPANTRVVNIRDLCEELNNASSGTDNSDDAADIKK